jgi:hypothetical protein
VRQDVSGPLNGSEKTVHERVFGDACDFFFGSFGFQVYLPRVIRPTRQHNGKPLLLKMPPDKPLVRRATNEKLTTPIAVHMAATYPAA